MLYIIFKDLYQSRKILLIYMLLGAFIIVPGYVNQVASVMLAFFIYILVYGVISRNEYNEDKNGGYTMLRTLPIKPYKIVVGKYITTMVLTAIGAFISFIIISVVNKSLSIGYAEKLALLSGITLSLLFSGMLYILIYRFGAATAINISRIVFFAIVILPSFLVSIFEDKLLKSTSIDLNEIVVSVEMFINNLSFAMTLMTVLIIYGIMMLISISIFEKRKAV